MHKPSSYELFRGFLTVGLYGFGGVLPWARWMMVEKRQWVDTVTFNEMEAFAQAMPGPNVINLSVVVGARYQGLPGALAALGGLIVMPFLIVITLGLAYDRWGAIPAIHDTLAAVSAAAAGLVIATAAKMLKPMITRRSAVRLLFCALAFTGVGFLGYSLVWVLLALAPISVWLAWRRTA